MALNPQQQKFKELYLDPGSETFGNAYKSAVGAGFTDNYARQITAKGNDWVCEIVRDKELLDLAEQRLRDALDLDLREAKYTKSVVDVAKFVSERLGKEKFSKRQELTGPDGKELPAPIMHVSRDDSDKED